MATISWNEEYAYEKHNRRNSAIVTIIIMALILLVLFILGLYRQNPPPEAGGTPLSFGFTSEGMDGITPTTTNPQPPAPSEPTPEPVAEPVTDPEILTQDFEEAPVMEIPKEQPKEQPKETPKETPKEPVKETPKETPKEPVKEAPKEPQPNPNAMLGKPGSSNQAGSSGIGNTPGMQGKPNGNGPSGIGTGTGTGNQPGAGGSGLGYGLAGRSPVKKATPKSEEAFGTVRITIIVNSQGKVIDARYSSEGSTTADSYLKQISIDAAYKWEWSADPDQPEQKGYIDFVYKRN